MVGYTLQEQAKSDHTGVRYTVSGKDNSTITIHYGEDMRVSLNQLMDDWQADNISPEENALFVTLREAEFTRVVMAIGRSTWTFNFKY